MLNFKEKRAIQKQIKTRYEALAEEKGFKAKRELQKSIRGLYAQLDGKGTVNENSSAVNQALMQLSKIKEAEFGSTMDFKRAEHEIENAFSKLSGEEARLERVTETHAEVLEFIELQAKKFVKAEVLEGLKAPNVVVMNDIVEDITNAFDYSWIDDELQVLDERIIDLETEPKNNTQYTSKSKSKPIFTKDYSDGGDGYWNTAGKILTNIRMYSKENAGKTKKRLLSDIYNPSESEYSFEGMIEEGYITVKDDKYYITPKGNEAILKASGYGDKTPSKVEEHTDTPIDASIIERLSDIKDVLQSEDFTLFDLNKLNRNITKIEEVESSLLNNELYQEVISLYKQAIDSRGADVTADSISGGLFEDVTLDKATQSEAEKVKKFVLKRVPSGMQKDIDVNLSRGTIFITYDEKLTDHQKDMLEIGLKNAVKKSNGTLEYTEVSNNHHQWEVSLDSVDFDSVEMDGWFGFGNKEEYKEECLMVARTYLLYHRNEIPHEIYLARVRKVKLLTHPVIKKIENTVMKKQAYREKDVVIFDAIELDSTNKVRSFQTYPAWKKAVKKLDPRADFTGDKEIDSAFKKDSYDAEFDGDIGQIVALDSITMDALFTYEELKNIKVDEPTEKQKEAGNYKKPKVRVAGFIISIENPKGSIRKGIDTDGKAWEITMKDNYGYINGTVGEDKDHVDVFLNSNANKDELNERDIFVVSQNDVSTGEFDEHKVIFGARNMREAKEVYHRNYDKDFKGFGSAKRMVLDSFKKWVDDLTKKQKAK